LYPPKVIDALLDTPALTLAILAVFKSPTSVHAEPFHDSAILVLVVVPS